MPGIHSRAALVEMAVGYFRSRAICAAARLDVADALSSGPLTVAQVADHCGANPDSLHRLLWALASIGSGREGCKERTAAKWRRLLDRAGLQLAGISPVEGNPVSVIEESR